MILIKNLVIETIKIRWFLRNFLILPIYDLYMKLHMRWVNLQNQWSSWVQGCTLWGTWPLRPEKHLSLGIQGHLEQHSVTLCLNGMNRGKRKRGWGEVEKQTTKITTKNLGRKMKVRGCSSGVKRLPGMDRSWVWSIAPRSKISKCADNTVIEYSFRFIRTVSQTVKKTLDCIYLFVCWLGVESRAPSSSVLDKLSTADYPQSPQSPCLHTSSSMCQGFAV